MAEWFKAHAWKACKGATLSRVRIPLSPPKKIYLFKISYVFFIRFTALKSALIPGFIFLVT